MIRDFEALKEMLRNQPSKKRVAVVAAQDEHTLQAVMKAYDDGLVEPVLIGDVPEIEKVLREIGHTSEGLAMEHIEDVSACAQRACDMARGGEIDCIMKGHLETGALLKVVVNKEHGIRKEKVMSLLAFMESPNYHKIFAITDVGLLTYPDLEQKKAAALNAVKAFHALGIDEPKVAVISAVEKVNPKMPDTVDGAAIKEAGIEGAIIEGPISYDLALDAESAKIKGYESPVAGDADILVVPDIVSGNIAAKAVTVLGGGRTGGTVLGALVPVLMASRSATADDKYMSIVISALVGKAC